LSVDYNRILTTALTPLAHPKRPHVLKQTSTENKEGGEAKQAGYKITPEDTYELSVVSGNRRKISFTQINAVEEKKKTDEDQQALLKARAFELDAAIVRTMKARKTMKWGELQSEVIKQLQSRFAPSTTMIKKRVESLLERKFLERDQNDAALYRYLA